MEIRQAYSVLGAGPTDTLETIKKKYHQLMLLYHPDTAGEDEGSLFIAKQLNEAYGLLRQYCQEGGESGMLRAGRSPSRREEKERRAGTAWVWEAEENRAAFCDRVLYEGSGMYDSGEILWHQSRRGKYNWDPDREDFRVFARSVNEACSELLGAEERKYGIYDRSDLREPLVQDEYRLKIFHLLIQQFVRPMFCLERIAQEHERGQEEGSYCLDCAAAPRGREQMAALSQVRPGDILRLELSGERMMLSSREGLPLGHLSFHEDSLYYVILLLRRGKSAVMEPQVRKIGKGRDGAARIMLRLFVKLGGREETGGGAGLNLQIGTLLQEYAAHLALHEQ